MNNSLLTSTLASLALISFDAFSSSTDKVTSDNEVQDMSDPLAVYTQAGLGYTDKGLNFKLGQTYDTGNDQTMGMNIIEVKGVAGEALGWESRESADDSIDSLRFRNFNVNLTSGLGSQVDINFGFTKEVGSQGTASYSLMQALPKFGPLSFYPLIGIGLGFGESFDSNDSGADSASDRWDVHGSFYMVGMYAKYQLSDKVWINYNPMYMETLTGSTKYKNMGFGGNSETLGHEIALSYQITPRSNIRYFANFSDQTSFKDGSHRIEVNYQF